MGKRTRKRTRKTKHTRRSKKQRGGNTFSRNIPTNAVIANPTSTDGGYKFDEVSTQ